jgi:hypothetical protein
MIQNATAEDYPQLKELMDKANAYAESMAGVKLWTIMDYAYDSLQRQVDRGETYIIHNSEGAITSAIGISEESSAWLHDTTKYGKSMYLTKLMKNPATAADTEAKELLKFAVKKAQQRGKKYLRCDTVSELEGLVNYYLRMGFKDKGHFTYRTSGRPGILLEIETEDLAKYLGNN